MNARKRSAANAAEREQIKLDQLPRNSVVLDASGHAWQNGGMYWYRAFGDDSMIGSWEMRPYGPFRVIHKPRA